MARKPTQEQLFTELLDRYGPEIAQAFRLAVADLRAKADLARVIEALGRNDLLAAVEALHLDPAAYGPLYDAIQQAYIAGGNAGATSLPVLKDQAGARFAVRFDARNFRAEAWLKAHSADLVTRIVEDQRLAVRTAMAQAMETGTAPRTAALQIVGRINPATGAREGGLLGLTEQQARAVQTARDELRSGETSALRNYLTRARRDKRFDRSIAKAIETGEPVPAETVRKALTKYEARLLQLRGEMIGRTEALRSLNAAQYEALQQAVASGQVEASAVRRTWRSAGDLRVRHTHMALNGDTVGFDQKFTSPSGARLRYPGDPEAPASETIGCRCVVSTRIDFLANLRG